MKILEELDDYEAMSGTADFEDDWRKGLSILAAETYRNAVWARFAELVGDLNTEIYRAGSQGQIQWRMQEPEFPAGVMDWSPETQRQRAAYEKRKKRFDKEFPTKIRAQIHSVITAFIARERP